MALTLARGHFVTLTIGTWSCEAMVTLASENGRSLIVMFDGAAPVGGGLALGMLALLQQDDGTFTDLMTGTPIEIARIRPV